MKWGYKVLIGIGIVVVLALVMFGQYIGWKNRLVIVDESTKTEWAQFESQLQRRLDLIPNLVADP